MTYENLDDFIIYFSKKINILSNYELNNQHKNSNFEKIFNELLNILIKRKKYGLDQKLWSELYFHSIYFYPELKKIGNIPITIVTKHNHILSFYMEKKLLNTTILHFDTHPDMNKVKNSIKLPKIYENYLSKKEDKYIDEAQEIVWDIGAAISGVLYTTGIQNYIWCMPEWIPDPEVNTKYFLRENNDKVTLYTNDTDLIDDEFCDILYTDKKSESKNCVYAKFQTGKNKKGAINKIIDIIGDKNKYVLDIDLDYFVCNGKKLNKKEYNKDPYDVSSFYRTKTIVINEENPRDTTENSEELIEYEKNIKSEIKYIDKRIKTFLKLISLLKNKGFIPSHISICDSTNIEFSKCQNCNTISNNYVPANLALYVNTHVFNGLIEIFG